MTSSETPTSLQGYIQQHRKELKNNQITIDEKKTKIKFLEQEITRCTGRHQIRHKFDLEEEVKLLKEQVKDLESNNTLCDYDEKVKPFLQEQSRCKEIFRMEDRLGKNVDTVSSQQKRRRDGSIVNSDVNRLMSFVRKKAKTDQLLYETGTQKTRVVDDYLMTLEGHAPPMIINNEDLCERCHEPLILESEQSILACKTCGTSKRYMDATNNATAYGEEVEFCAYSYQRINYFNEYLTMFQAKETSQVAQKDMEIVMAALWEERIYDTAQISLEKIREIVRKKRMNQVYKQITQIWCRITGNLPPRLTAKQEEKCRRMFRAIQEPYERHCPPERKNFFSYNYCMYKFMQLLGYPQFLKYFTLLKDIPKLKAMDDIWRKICTDLEWEFIESPRE